MPVIYLVAACLPIALRVVMIGTGVLNFADSSLVGENFVRWGWPVGFHVWQAVSESWSGLLLAIPVTSLMGAIAGAIFMLAAVATLIRSRDWGHLLGAALIAATVTAVAIHP